MDMNKKIKLIVTRDILGIINRKAGEEIEYFPWDFEWQGMTECERVDKGLFVHCFGHGEFEVLRLGEDVEKADA